MVYDSRHALKVSENTKRYLEAILPQYKEIQLNKDILAKVSGDFFVEIYQPIQHILPQYEFWQKKEKEFKMFVFITIVFTLLTMLLVLFQFSCIQMWVYKSSCVLCCGLLTFGLYKLIKIENLSKKIMR